MPEEDVRQPVRWQYRERVLVLAAFANSSQLGTRLLISPVVPAILVAFDVSKSAVGLVLTGMWAAYALSQFPSGVLGDRYGERRIILVALGSAAVACLLLAAAPTFPLFGLFVVLLGAGAGLYFPPATSLLTRLFANTGQALGFHTAGGALAGLLAPVAAAYVGARYGWRAAILLGVTMLVVAFAVTLVAIRSTPAERPHESIRDRLSPRRALSTLSSPALVHATFLGVVASFTWQSFSSFFPTFLVEHHALSTELAGVVFGGVMVISVVSMPALGRLSDRFARQGTLAAALLAAAIGIGLFVVGGPAATVVGVAFTGIGLGWGGVLHSLFMDHFPAEERASGFGLVRTVYMIIGSLGSVVTGTLADVAGWTVAYGVVVGLLGVAILSIAAGRVGLLPRALERA